MIRVLSKETIEQIAAGEVVERPMSVVKELVENAIDAGATAVSVEIRNGGIDLIRVTDNGSGIAREEIPTAFLNHATSKITDISDVSKLRSLGFRGEALPSISSVSEIELITKRKEDPTGTRYELRGNEFVKEEEIGAPDGTTILVKNLFFNTPARRKFLKTGVTEGSYITDLFEKIALSHPSIRMKLSVNGRDVVSTPGTGSLKDTVYAVYGRNTVNETIEISSQSGPVKIEGLIGKPVVSKGNRAFEICFLNGRYIRSKIVEKAVEDAYQPFMMQHRYPFTILFLTLPEDDFDVNVHPSKMEVRFLKEGELYDAVCKTIGNALSARELIPDAKLMQEEKERREVFDAPEPFERRGETTPDVSDRRPAASAGLRPMFTDQTAATREERPQTDASTVRETATYQCGGAKGGEQSEAHTTEDVKTGREQVFPCEMIHETSDTGNAENKQISDESAVFRQQTFFENIEKQEFRLIGQVFDTYWLIEMEGALFIMDQHAAHEKVLYERTMRSLSEQKPATQYLSPGIQMTLGQREEEVLLKSLDVFRRFGFEIEPFGGREYILTGVPDTLTGIDSATVFQEILAGLSTELSDAKTPDSIAERVASMSCKAAVKGNHALTVREADTLLREMLTLDNPYACPHGRPTIIKITKTELEKKFKRII